MAAPKKTGLSLYADLLDPNKKSQQGATISGAPVRYDVQKAQEEEEVQKKKDASLKFQPIKRPQVQPKAKPKVPPSSSSAHKFSSSTVTASINASSPDRPPPGSTPQQPSVQRSNFEDWVGDEDDEHYYQPGRPRQNKKKRKKNKASGQETRTWDWDDIYDPTLPNSYADYKGSEEQYREIRDWKARLYYHQLKEAKKEGRNGREDSGDETQRSRPMNSMFAPPSNLSFAPPSLDNDSRPPPLPANNEDDDDYYPEDRPSSNHRMQAPPSFAPASMHDDPTGEDAYMRRMRLSKNLTTQSPLPTDPRVAATSVPTPPPVVSTPPALAKTSDADVEAKKAEAQAKIAAFKAKLQQKAAAKAETAANAASAPGQQAEASVVPSQPPAPPTVQPAPPPPPPPPADEPGNTISRAPVRYTLPPPPPDSDIIAEDEPEQQQAEQTRSNRPGQKGFAERMMKKYGWEKGQGLGASGDGITTALVGKVDKRKKLSDAEGGGYAQPRMMGKITGGKRRKVEDETNEEADRYGTMSEVVKLTGMLDGLDVQKEIEENNLMQEVGDEMQKQYGMVERVFIWREAMGGNNEVFVKFTSQLSAMRAVSATDGMTFAGNGVVAKYWDTEKFEAGVYDE